MTAHDDAMPDDITDAEAFHWDRFDDDEPRPRHSPHCSSNPEIGCECGLVDRDPCMCLDCGTHYAERERICSCHEPVMA